jgi:hypothetical protein
MRRLSVWSVLLLAVACAVQNNPLPTGNDDDGGASGSGGAAGKAGAGGSSSQAGTVNKAGTSAGGKAGAGTGGNEPQGGDASAGEPSGGGMGGKGGTGGAGGVAGSGGTGGKGGTGGAAGSGGAAGTGGTGGSAGSGGNGGSGGSGGACMAAMSAPVAGVSARYLNEPGPATSMGAQLELYNAGPNTLNLADLKLRYYFTNEVTAPLQITINWAWYRPTAGGGQDDKLAKVQFANVKLSCKANNADSYLEFSFKADAGLLEPSHLLIFSFVASNGMGQSFTLSNDYSYDAAAKIDADDSKIVIFQNSGTRAWGTEP